ncbi:pentatricopeptide repeat-containing protein At1g80550, mitochondrial-like [Magnolia sinica]|uniref:pentatricopeptide repeat-containing protein At1g80550, mitochondrial-like n=1 Tax=Magnolia sinica TaxID=86752 RepID=UPI00265B491C|nr:pentatricopeptide repeat-containing protein At1g80550, mitochondrial-like [Magnolia sinica]
MPFFPPLFSNRFRSSPSLVSPRLTFLNFHNYPSTTPEFRAKTLESNPSIKTPDSVDFDPSTVAETISSYANDWKRALDFFNWVEKDHRFEHTVDTYNRTIDVLGKFFEFDLAWGLIGRMQERQPISPDHTTFRIMFKRYASAHLIKEAVDTYDRTADYGLKDKTSFFNLIDALCEYRHVIEADELCKKMGSEFSAEHTKMCNIILRGWFKMGWWSKCREFWEEMDRMGIARDLHSYSIYMDIQCKSGKPWRVDRFYKEMKKKGIPLDVVVYNTVINAVGLSDGADESIRVFREMMEFGCQPNVVTYNTVIKILCREGRIRQAYVFLEQMHNKGVPPNVITYHCFFRCLDRPKEIMKLFERMVKDGCRPRMETYVMLIKKFGRWGFLRPVFIVWDRMKEHGCSPDGFAYNALIDALVQKGMVEMARKYDEEMLAKGLSAKPRRELGTKVLSDESDDECR